MHIPDGFVNGAINTATFGISGCAVAYAIKKANKFMGEKQVPLLGVTAAFIFAAQMLNFPVAGGTSGHFLGAMLAAILLGPWLSCLVIALVLTIQCLGFADGGLTALGTNIFNMGVIGGIFCFYIFSFLKKIFPENRNGFLAATGVASWFSIVLVSGFCAVELAYSGTSPIHIVLPAMLGVHMIIGIGEAIITVMVISMVLATRRDLVTTWGGMRVSENV